MPAYSKVPRSDSFTAMDAATEEAMPTHPRSHDADDEEAPQTTTSPRKVRFERQASIETVFDSVPSWESKAIAYNLAARERDPSLLLSEPVAGLWNLVGSAGIAFECLLAADTIVGVCLAVTCTLFYWYCGQSSRTNMSWE
jgi:hypothetical protein